jgi:CRISPR-associated endonuclease/helicase Cas3
MNRSRIGASPWPLDPADLGRQGNRSDAAVLLDLHSQGVAKRTAHNASQLSGRLRDCLRDAARLHDIGKLDPRFQALLHGCFLHAVEGREMLAKSGRAANPQADRELRDSLGLPAGFRHELLSTKIVADAPEWQDHPERDLLLHLIASHHGRCRGFAPVMQDDQPEPFEVDAGDLHAIYPGCAAPMASLAEGVPSRFWSLTRRFGWWGLAYLETLLRLADQAESANPSEQ